MTSKKRLNIAFDFGNFWGGSPLSLAEYCRLVSEDGHRVFVLAQTLEGSEIVSAYAAEIFTYPPAKPHFPLAMYKLARWYLTIFRQNNIHLVHGIRVEHLPPLGFAANTLGIAIVMTKATNSTAYHFLYKLYSATWIAYNPEYRRSLEQVGIRNAIQIQNRLDLVGKIPVSCTKPNITTCINVVWLGRLVNEKIQSLYTLVDTITALDISHKVNLVVLGSGPQAEDSARYAHSELARGRHTILFAGYVMNPLEYLRDAHICIGMGRCIVEALACGCFAIVGNAFGEGLLITEDNVNISMVSNFTGRGCSFIPMEEAFSNAVSLLSDGRDPPLRDYIISEFDTSYAKDKILNVYSAVSVGAKFKSSAIVSNVNLFVVLVRLLFRHIRHKFLG